MRQMFDVNNSLNTEFSGFAFYGEQPQHPSYYSNDRYNYQTSQGMIGDMSSRNYAQMNDISHHTQAYQVLTALQNEKKNLNSFETQIKMEFEDSHPAGHHYNNQHHENYEENISQSLPDIRSYSDSSPHHLSLPHHQYQRAKSLSHPPSPNMMDSSSPSSSDGGDDSPKIHKRSSSTTSKGKDSSRPRMYKFNPKPLTLNPSMKRAQTAADSKDGEYWEKRKKNNEASRRSRLARRLKECMVMEEMKKLKRENEELKAELTKIQSATVCRM